MRHWTFILISFLLFSCNPKTDKNADNKENGIKYFDYDNIDHYFNDFDKDKILDLYGNKSNSELDSIKVGVAMGGIPADSTDLTFVDKLETIGYAKKVIDKSKFEKIDEIFVEKTVNKFNAYACVHVYRDILVFKKNDKVVGVAKICFECNGNEILGTASNTENFGQDGDYNRLSEILKN